jgi:hypothetical protein
VVAIDHFLKQRAAGALGDHHVQPHVLAVHHEREIGVAVARRKAIEEYVDLLGMPPQILFLARSGALGEEAGRLRLERFAQLVQIPDVALRRNANARAGARSAFDESRLFEAAQRIGDRHHAHSELAREAPPRQRRTGAETAAQDLFANGVIRLVRQAHDVVRTFRH